jgi:hypothetical protein
MAGAIRPARRYRAVPIIVTVPLPILLLRDIDPRWILIAGLSAVPFKDWTRLRQPGMSQS